MLDQLSRGRRKEVLKAAGDAYKSGLLPTPTPSVQRPLARHEQRQLMKALGWRGTKAKRHTVERDARKFVQVMAVEEALDRAKERVEHPIAARLRRR